MKAVTIACAILATAAAAQPHNHRKRHVHNVHNNKRHEHGHGHIHDKRALVTEWVTETVYVTEYQDLTTTILIPPGGAATANEAKTTASSPGQFFEGASSAAPPAGPSTAAAAPPAAANTPAAAPAPAPSSSAAAAPAAPSANVNEASGSSGSAASPAAAADALTGDLTFYQVGLGACGFDDSGKDRMENIVALSHELMGVQSNGNPYCGRTITISFEGRTTTAVCRDKCMGCKYGDIDVSEKAFLEIFGTLDVGRKAVQWWFN